MRPETLSPRSAPLSSSALEREAVLGYGERRAHALEIRDAAAAEARPLRQRFARASEHPIAPQLTAKPPASSRTIRD
jgi:hypothetical protein